MSLGAQLRAFKAKAVGRMDTIVSETVTSFSGRVVTDWTPFGDPALWKAPPPADYRPGNLQSSWFLSAGQPSTERTEATDSREVHGLDQLADHPAGSKIYLANSADHAGAIEGGHSTQAPVGIMVRAAEFAPMAAVIARKAAA